MFNQLISQLETQASGGSQLVNRGEVVDNLLDLRSAAQGNRDITSRIDQHLGEVPGVTVVSNVWWQETLAELNKVSTFVALV